MLLGENETFNTRKRTIRDVQLMLVDLLMRFFRSMGFFYHGYCHYEYFVLFLFTNTYNH